MTEIRATLERHGYEVAIEQDDHYENSILYNFFAHRERDRVSRKLVAAGAQLDETSLRQMRERANKHEEAMNRRKQLSQERKDR